MFSKMYRKNCRRKEQHLTLEFEQLEERAMLAVSAVFVPATGNMFISGDSASDTIVLSRLFRGEILLNGTQVSTATFTNTRSIVINAGAGNDTITIDQTNGPIGPGLGNESGIREIEIFVNGQAGDDRLEIIGQFNADIIDLGQAGINLNNDNDVDVTISSIEFVLVDGRDGSDRISAGGNTVVGEAFSQRLDLRGGRGNDILIGGTANDVLRGQDGNDSLNGGVNNDNLIGGTGDDFLVSDSGNDTFNGGLDVDRLVFQIADGSVRNFVDVDRSTVNGNLVLQLRLTDGGPSVQIAFAKEVEKLNIEGSQSDDDIDLSLLGLADVQALGVTEITVDGKAGNDLIRGSGASDAVIGNDGDDLIFGLGGDDRLFGGNGNDTLNGNAGNDFLNGNAGDDILNGGAGDDQLFGDDGNDTLDGGSGNNFLDEGPGQGGIVFRGTKGDDVIQISRRERNGVSQVIFDLNGKRSVNTYRNGETIIVFAGDGDDIVEMKSSAGSRWQAFFDGQRGNDVLIGGAGDDELKGGQGNDVLIGRAGNDLLQGDSGRDVLLGGTGNDVLIGSPLQQLISGVKPPGDVFLGGPGNNVIVDDLF